MVPEKDGNILSSKMDIKDGFWRMVCEEGQELNIAYVLPNHLVQPPEIVVPSALQMGWVLSPPFFCTASETVHDVASSYVCETQGALPEHSLEDLTMPEEEFILPDMSKALGKAGATFLHVLEACVDDFIQLAQTLD